MMKNLGLKLFSLIVAIGLSLFVNGETNSSVMSFNVPVEIKNLPIKKILVRPLSPQVKVMVRGPSYLVKQAVSSNNTFKVNAPRDMGKRLRAQFTKEDLNLPGGIQVLAIEPAELELTFDNRETKQVQIVVPHIGELKPDLRLNQMIVRPSEVTLSGPSEDIERVVKLETDPLDLSQIQDGGIISLEVNLPSPLTSVDPRNIAVQLDIRSVESSQLLDQVPVEVRSRAGAGFIVVPDKVSLEISGPKNTLSKLNLEQIVPYVTLAPGVKEGDSVAVYLSAPNGVSLVTSKPERLSIKRVGQEDSKSAQIKR